MPKVLRIINRFNLGGITYNVSYLSRYMSPEFETMLIGGPEEASEESSLFIPLSLGLQPMLIAEMQRSVNPLSDLMAYRRIRKIINDFKPDIVHTHASKAGAIGRLAAIHAGVPVIVHTFHGHVFRGYFNTLITKAVIATERYLARKSSAIIAISKTQQKDLCDEFRICPRNKTRVIELGFDLERFTQNTIDKRKAFRQKFGLKEDQIAIGIIGRLAPIKNHELFLDAIAHVVSNSKSRIKAVIVGDGETKANLKASCEKLGLKFSDGEDPGATVIFTGWVREADQALAGLDIVCLTSKNEGTPVSLIEAQAAGRFIVSTNVGGIGDILNPSCGLLSAADDKAGFMKNLLYAVNNFNEVQARAGAGRAEVLQRFSYERLCSEMSALYNSLLNDHGRKP